MERRSVLVAVLGAVSLLSLANCAVPPYPTSTLLPNPTTIVVGGLPNAWDTPEASTFFQDWAKGVNAEVGDQLQFQWGPSLVPLVPRGPGPNPAPGPGPGAAPSPTPTPGPGPFPGPSPGPAPGPFPAPSPGPAPGPFPGPSPGPAPGPFPGPSPGPAPGPLPGPFGPAPGPLPGPFGPAPGPLPGPFGPAPGPLPGPFGPAPGPVPGPFGPAPGPLPGPFGPAPGPLPGPFGPAPGPLPGPFGPAPGPLPGPFGPAPGPLPGPFGPAPGPLPGPFGPAPGPLPGPFGPAPGPLPGPFGPAPGPLPGPFGPAPGPLPGPFGPAPGPLPGPFGPAPGPLPGPFGPTPGPLPGPFGPAPGPLPGPFGPAPGPLPGPFGPAPGPQPGLFGPALGPLPGPFPGPFPLRGPKPTSASTQVLPDAAATSTEQGPTGVPGHLLPSGLPQGAVPSLQKRLTGPTPHAELMMGTSGLPWSREQATLPPTLSSPQPRSPPVPEPASIPPPELPAAPSPRTPQPLPPTPLGSVFAETRDRWDAVESQGDPLDFEPAQQAYAYKVPPPPPMPQTGSPRYHNCVQLPSFEAYVRCDFSVSGITVVLPTTNNANAVMNVDLSTPGVHYYASSVGIDCRVGMKFSINVAQRKTNPCSDVQQYSQISCSAEAQASFSLRVAECNSALNRQSCFLQTFRAMESAKVECSARYVTGQKICHEVGQKPYLPNGTAPFRYVPKPVGNKFLPLKAATYTYFQFSARASISATVVVRVMTSMTTVINGVACVAVRRTTHRGNGTQGPVVDDNAHWCAQDTQGNVWYFGFIASLSCQVRVLASARGAYWVAGQGGAKPGLAMLASASSYAGASYRQFLRVGQFESVAKVVGTVTSLPSIYVRASAALKAVVGPFLHIEETHAYPMTQLRDVYYKENVGMVLSVNRGDGSWSAMDRWSQG
eukprot:jgi/Mesvir1/7053/Mv09169-RA.1